MQYLQFGAWQVLSMIIFVAILVAVCIWAQSFRKKQQDIIGKRKYFFIFSGVLLVLCVGSLVFRGLNLGLDFTGGSIVEIGFYQKVDAVQVREVVTTFTPQFSEKDATADPKVQLGEVALGSSGEKKDYRKGFIQTKRLDTRDVDAMIKHIQDKLGKVEVERRETIGPVVGDELKQKALLAIFIALGLQLVYITLRFGTQIRFGLAADVALVHDVVVMVGVYSLSGRQVDSPFLAALLTVIGYSVMDSIVIFDRIRENMKLIKKGSYEEIVNTSVNQTMTRSINTLMTVLICLFALYYFGGLTLKNFAFSLLVGVTSGAYSSIFIASPILVLIDQWVKKREEERVKTRRAELQAQAEAKKLKSEAKKAEALQKPVKKAVNPMEQDYPGVAEMPELASEDLDSRSKEFEKAKAKKIKKKKKGKK